MISDVPLDGRYADPCDIDVPPVDIIALGKRGEDTRVDCVPVHDLELGEADALFEAGGCPHA